MAYIIIIPSARNTIDDVLKWADSYMIPRDCLCIVNLKDNWEYETLNKLKYIISETGPFMDHMTSLGYTVCVTCNLGVSRSATIVIAWLIVYCDMDYDDAYSMLRRKRNIRPNTSFGSYFLRLLELRHKYFPHSVHTYLLDMQ